MNANAHDEQLMSTEAVAHYVDVPVATVRKWRYRGTGPRASKVGRHVRYRRSDVDAWLDSHVEVASA